MNDEQLYFGGCFSPGWLEDIPKPTPYEKLYQRQNKDLDTLKSELEEIKDHLQDVQARQWNLAKLLEFHAAGLERN